MKQLDYAKKLLLPAFLTMGALGCQQDLEAMEGPGAQVRDSTGIRIIENASPAEGSLLGWRIGAEPSASIGVREGEEPYMLHNVFGATRLSDGRIVVANHGSSELRVFDEFGTHLVNWGGRGEGPGEFSGDLHQVRPLGR